MGGEWLEVRVRETLPWRRYRYVIGCRLCDKEGRCRHLHHPPLASTTTTHSRHPFTAGRLAGTRTAAHSQDHFTLHFALCVLAASSPSLPTLRLSLPSTLFHHTKVPEARRVALPRCRSQTSSSVETITERMCPPY